jgi:hypothetical protein
VYTSGKAADRCTVGELGRKRRHAVPVGLSSEMVGLLPFQLPEFHWKRCLMEENAECAICGEIITPADLPVISISSDKYVHVSCYIDVEFPKRTKPRVAAA